MNCVVPGCGNTTLDPNITFFEIPADGVMRHDWLQAIGREDLLYEPYYRSYSICEIHFPHDAIWVVKSLKPGAFPTQYVPNNKSFRRRPYYNIHIPENFTRRYYGLRKRNKKYKLQNIQPTTSKGKPHVTVKTEPGVETKVKTEILKNDLFNMSAQFNRKNSENAITSTNSSTPVNNNFLDIKIKMEPADYNDN